jgi:UDP-glucose-4-epimerase GalE
LGPVVAAAGLYERPSPAKNASAGAIELTSSNPNWASRSTFHTNSQRHHEHMTTLVTGGAGYVGSQVVFELLASGDNVIVIDNLSTGSRHALPPETAFFDGDCGDQQLVGALIDDHDITAIIHLAGSAVVAESIDDPAGYYRNNVANTSSLIKIAADRNIRHFVLCSTAAVYGNCGAAPLSEETSPEPISPYGKSMLMSEMMLQDVAAAHRLRYVILRAFNAAGIDPIRGTSVADCHPSNLVSRAVQVALGAAPAINVYGTQLRTHDGSAVRDYVHVSDLARALVAALSYLRTGGADATLNCGNGHGRSVIDVIRTVESVCGSPLAVRYLGPRPGDPATLIADIGRIRADLKWTPRFDDLETMVSHVLTASYRRAQSRESARPLVRLVAESGVPAGKLKEMISGFGARSPLPTTRNPTDALPPRSLPGGEVRAKSPPVKATKKLTIGMATYDDYDGVYFTLQAIRLYHPEILHDVEFLVIDNNPSGLCGPALRDLGQASPAYRYFPKGHVYGTTIKDWVFQEAHGRYVLCVDCHILIAPGALKRLIDFFEADPETNDLLQGPLIYDDLKGYATHFKPEWQGGMYGTWDSNPAGAHADLMPFEIHMQGMGLFACRRDAWPGFNPAFRGFGGEEGYIHEKFRQRGGKTLCLPFLRWMHRFNRPFGVPYPNIWTDRVRNYLIGFREVGWDTGPIIDHFKAFLGEGVWAAVTDALEPGLVSGNVSPVAEHGVTNRDAARS